LGLNDTLPLIQEFLKNDDGSPIDCTLATNVLFNMWRFDSGIRIPVVVDGVGTFLDKPNGKVQYAWISADSTTTGEHQRRWTVLFGSDRVSVPNDRTKGYPVFIS
jgi:hypothetical protein